MKDTRIVALACAVLAGFCAWVMLELADDLPPRDGPTVAIAVEPRPLRGTPGDPPDAGAAIELAREVWFADQQRQIDEYLAVTHYLNTVHEENVRAAAAAAARSAPRSSSGSRSVGSTVGECSGFAIPDYIIQRESGGNPSAYNPSGAYGCAQTLLSHYSRGSCAGLDPYTIDGQRECVWRLSNGGTNLAPWAATR